MKVSALAFLPLIAAEADLFSHHQRDLAGGQYLACPGDLVKFQSSVVVNFDGYDTDPNDVTRIDFQALETLFMESYNSLSSYLCDEDYREVLHVTVERNEDGSKITRLGGDQYSILYTVEAQCRGCDPQDTLLFSPPGSYHRALDEPDTANEYHDAIINEDGTVSEVGHRFAKSSKKGSPKGKGKGGPDDDWYYPDPGPGKGKGKGGPDDDWYYDEPGPGSKKSGSKKGSKKDSKKGSPSKKGPPPPKKGPPPPKEGPPPPKSGSSKSGSVKVPGKGGGGGGKGGGGGGDYCKCDSPYPEYRAPTEEEFRVVYDSAIRDYKDSGLVPPRRGGVSVDVIIRVMETTELSCSDVTEDFSALVSVEFFGDAKLVTEQERKVLAENFVYTYNALQAERCDSPLFRQAEVAEIAMQAKPEEPRVFIYIFRVDGICHGLGCSANLTLFDLPSATDARMLYYDPEWNQAELGAGDTGNAACSCPVFTELTGAPTTDDFEVRFFGIFQELKARGDLPNIGASGNVIELPYGASAEPTTAPTITGVPGSTPAPTITEVPGGTPAPTTSEAPTSNIPRGDTPAPSLSQSPTSGATTKAPVRAPVTKAPVTKAPVTVAPSTAPTGVSSAPSAAGATPAPTTANVTSSPAPTTTGTPAPSTTPTTGGGTPAPSTNGTISPAPTTLANTTAPTIAPTSGNATEAPTSGNATEAPTVAPSANNGTETPTVAPSINNGTETPTVAPTTAGNATVAPTTANATTQAPSISAVPSVISGGTPQPSISAAPSAVASGGTPQPSTSAQPSSSFAPISPGGGNETLGPTSSFQPTSAST